MFYSFPLFHREHLQRGANHNLNRNGQPDLKFQGGKLRILPKALSVLRAA